MNVHDFADEELGKVIPYGVYDLALNAGWVNLGIDHDTAAFAVASIERWWKQMGKQQYPHADKLLITADCGGSNGYRTRLWKVRLQRLADDIRIPISVRHFLPARASGTPSSTGCSLHQPELAGKPLIDRATVINLIAHTQTQKGLRITAVLDKRKYQTGKKVPDAIMHALLLQEEPFHGEWNYNILPRRK